MTTNRRQNRRDFLKKTVAGTAAAATVPYIFTSNQVSAEDKKDKPTLAAIGVGGSRGRYNRGGTVAMQAARFGDMVAVCDVDSLHASEFNKKEQFGGKLQEFVDYREMLDKVKPDVVTIGTTDHWHVPIAIAAMRAGSDVYCEKPLTLTIDEGKEICKVVKETGKVFQVGTQQRTEHGGMFAKAVALVQGGYIGDNVTAHIAIGGAPGDGPWEPQTVPDQIDWDFWVGPAQEAPYLEQRRRFFRWFLEYSGGKMTDWGAHHIDIAQWAIGASATGPTEIGGSGTFPGIVPKDFDWVGFFAGKEKLPHGYNAATKFDIDLKFDNGSTLNVNHHYTSEDGKTKFPNGILFVGDKGRFFVNRGKLTGKPVEELTEDDNKKLDEAVLKLHKDKKVWGHMGNFFECVGDRSEPVSDVYSHHRTMTSCHMCNIALMTGRDLKWDPQAEQFIGDETANALMSRPSREKYLS